MSPSATINAPPAATASRQADPAGHLPPGALAAFERFQSGGDPEALDQVLFAILDDFGPKTPKELIAEMSGGTRLIEDLGFDSLAITEVVFFTEELFGINISNGEIVQVRTLDDLRGFIHAKVTDRSVR